MKKTGIILICSLLLVSCSITDIPIPNFSTSPTQAEATVLPPTPALKPTDTPTLTATLPTPTFTSTPTLVNETPSTVTDTVTPTVTASATVIYMPASQSDGFSVIDLSTTEFYVGDCEPSTVVFTVKLDPTSTAVFVQLFVQLKSTITGATSEWSSLPMQNMGGGTFTHTLIASEIKALKSFENPWVRYQLVSADGNGNPLTRTQIFDQLLSLKTCKPTPIPTVTPP